MIRDTKRSGSVRRIRDRAERGLITSIEFIKELTKLIRKDALSELEKRCKRGSHRTVSESKTERLAVVERIVTDIDEIVLVRFPNWQTTASGEREVKKSLRSTLLKYQLHRNQDLFERAYEYIKQYY